MLGKITDKLPRFKLTTATIIVVILLGLAVFIAFTSIGGSKTLPIQSTQPAPNYQSDPQSQGFPGSSDGLNASNFQPPEGFNPPASSAAQLGDIFGGSPPDFNAQPSTGDVGTNLPPIGSTPNPGRPNVDTPTTGNPLDNPQQNHNLPNLNNTDTGSPFKFPDRPNKAGNLWNLTSIHLFSDTKFEITISLSIPEFSSPNMSSSLFFVVLLAMFYIPNAVISSLISIAFGKDEDSDTEKNVSIFFRPDESELQKRREEQRKKKLQHFSDYIDEIIGTLEQKMRNNEAASDIIVSGYLHVDEAFAQFINLKRNKSLTPLEHSHQRFETEDINNDAMEQIVNFFYLTRFGNKEMTYVHVNKFITQLRNLVQIQESENSNGWSIF